MPRARGAAGADRPATPRPAHRHGRRAQREALVVVVPGPVQRVLELWPRTALGLADAFLTLVVHPARGGCHRLVPRPRLSSLPATNAASPARAAATPKRPSLRPGAFKVAFQKIHSPATSRASGWVKGGCPPRPATACGPPLAAATPGSALIRAGRAPCWEGHVGLAALRRRLAPPRPGGVRTTSGRTSPRCCALPVELQLTPTLCVCVVWSAAGVLCSFRGRNAKLRDRAVPFLRSGGSSLGEVAEGYVAPGRRPPTVRRARARILAAPRPPTPTDDPRDERGLQGHVAPAQRFRFSGEPGPGAEETVLEVRVPQVLHVQYGMYVWPCAVVLAQYLWCHRRSLPGKAVLEIGAGVSLPGVLAAKCGAKVILSDNSELPHCLELCKQSCHMNNLPQVQVVGLTWGHISQDLLALPPQDIILASDVFFEPEDFEDILTTVYFLMQKNPKVQLWSTYQVRSADWSLEALLYKWDMKCVHIPLESFDADKENIAESALPGRHTVEMLIISFAKDSL